MVSQRNDGSCHRRHSRDRVGFHLSFLIISTYFLFYHCSFHFVFVWWFICFKLCFRHAIVSDLAAFGAAVHTCSRTQTELDKCLEEWQSEGIKVTGSVCDVSSPLQRKNLIEEVASILNGKLNIYVSMFYS